MLVTFFFVKEGNCYTTDDWVFKLFFRRRIKPSIQYLTSSANSTLFIFFPYRLPHQLPHPTRSPAAGPRPRPCRRRGRGLPRQRWQCPHRICRGLPRSKPRSRRSSPEVGREAGTDSRLGASGRMWLGGSGRMATSDARFSGSGRMASPEMTPPISGV